MNMTVTVLSAGKVPAMPPHAWFGRCSLCRCEIRVDSSDEHVGPPLPPHMPVYGVEKPLKDPRCDSYDQNERISVKCPIENCGRMITCIRKAV